jgi:hypothetical protein
VKCAKCALQHTDSELCPVISHACQVRMKYDFIFASEVLYAVNILIVQIHLLLSDRVVFHSHLFQDLSAVSLNMTRWGVREVPAHFGLSERLVINFGPK